MLFYRLTSDRTTSICPEDTRGSTRAFTKGSVVDYDVEVPAEGSSNRGSSNRDLDTAFTKVFGLGQYLLRRYLNN